MQNDGMLPRGLDERVKTAWASTPVLTLEGARAVGKTEIAKRMAATGRFISFLDKPNLDQARIDLRGFLEGLPTGSVLDEAQLIPNLQIEVKRIVDQTGRPGQFLLTGSARFSRNELGGTDPLAGRTRRVEVHPFAQCEVERHPRDVVTALFEEDPREWQLPEVAHREVLRRFLRGGFPLLRAVAEDRVRYESATEFVEALFNGDVYETERNRSGITKLFRYLSSCSGEQNNFSKYQNATELGKSAVVGYLDALQTVYLVNSVSAFSGRPGTRETDRERNFVIDPVFVASALGMNSSDPQLDAARGGPFLETVVAQELKRTLGWSTTNAELRHWRRNDQEEVDLLLERDDGMLVAIEVKSARSVSNREAAGIAKLKATYPDRFHRGFVVHPGDCVLPLGSNIWALPISALWAIGESIGMSFVEPLTFQQRLDRVVGQVQQEHQLISREQVLERQEAVRVAMPKVHQGLMAIATALSELGVKALTMPAVWPGGWDRHEAESTEVVLVDSAQIRISIGADPVASLSVESTVAGHTISWKLTSAGFDPAASFDLKVEVPWDGDQTTAIDELFSALIDRLPDVVRSYRALNAKGPQS